MTYDMSIWDNIIFAVQDRSGTVAQLTTDDTVSPVEVNDIGVYTGLSWNGTLVSRDFTVVAVNDDYNFCISTVLPSGAAGNILNSAWPEKGTIQWVTGGNIAASPTETIVTARNVANAYCTANFFCQYALSRGYPFPESPIDNLMAAIVQATDYIDQRYRFKGIKLFQFLTNNPALNPSIGFLDPWLGDLSAAGTGPPWFTPSYTSQMTEWPRQGCVDYNGDSVFGIPVVIQQAVCEGALRVLAGTSLQPDYDPSVVTAGGVVSSISQEVGPIKKTVSYNTTLGLSFFPTVPHIDRMLRSAGILLGGGGRSIIL
jgi:hypothetical protein